MEHLPRRIGQEKSIFPAIPYLCQDRYDGGTFLDYPRRLGLPNFEDTRQFCGRATLSRANQILLAAMPIAELEPFLQNWLFFGLLKEVLGDLYRHEDFVTAVLDCEIEKTIVTTANLLSRLEAWEANIKTETEQHGRSLMEVYQHVARCLNLTQVCLNANPAFDNDLKFHLASVAETVGYAASKACNVAWTDDPRRSLIPIDWSGTVSDHFRRSLLLERSTCCPSQMEMLSTEFKSPQVLAFIASCFHDDFAHTYHSSCDEHGCQAGDLMIPGQVTRRQVTRHVSDSCGCGFLHIDEKDLVDCLEKGCLPLLKLKEDNNLGEMSIEIVSSTNAMSYVALSHVWADGLGNYTATALPRCQLSRLKGLIDNLNLEYLKTLPPSDRPENAPEMLLWCDTLCCPVVSPEGKKLALRQMYRTYDEASLVLVLDRGLVSKRVGGMSVDEACLRIATSRWMTRLWTLQEGALPARTNKLWFQFTSRAVSYRALYYHLVEVSETDIQRRGVVDRLKGRFYALNTLLDVQSRDALMGAVIDGLKYRSVTVPSDEPLIIATLLGLDLKKMLESELKEERMKIFWVIMGTSPSGINKYILFHMGPKIQQRGLRWALQSLLSVDRHFAMRSNIERKDRGILALDGTPDGNARGLVVEFAGFRISIAKPANGLPEHIAGFNSKPRNHNDRHHLLMKDCQGRWYVLRHRLLEHVDRRPAGLEEMCAVISDLSSPWVLYDGSTSPIPEDTKAYHGLLVEAARNDEEQLQTNELQCVDIKSHVAFGHVPTEMNHICQGAYHLTQELLSSAAGRYFEDLGTRSIDVGDPVYQEALKSLEVELERLSRSPFAMEALAASGNSADQGGFARIADYIEKFYLGAYMQIEEYVPGDRKWCVE